MIHGMMEKQLALRGKVAILTCQGNGSPQPTIAFLKNGQKIKNSSRVTLSSSTSRKTLVTSKIVITGIKYEDSGVYTCVIDNRVGRTNSSGTLLVHGKFCDLFR